MRNKLLSLLLLCLLPLSVMATDAANTTLIDQNSDDFVLSSLKGKVVLMAFGFTNCPHICPIEMGRVATSLRLLESHGDKVHGLFITVDRERDTPEAIKKYIAKYHTNITGLTGTQANLDSVSDYYRIKRVKQPTGGDSYQVDHDAALFVLNQQGEVDAAVPAGLPPSHIVKLVQNLLDK